MVVMLLLCVSGIVYIIQPQPTALAAADPMRQAIEGIAARHPAGA